MTPITNLALKFNCQQDINKMKPCATGKFCGTCSTIIIDFRNKDAEALTNALHINPEICGIFSEAQTPRIQLLKRNFLGNLKTSHNWSFYLFRDDFYWS